MLKAHERAGEARVKRLKILPTLAIVSLNRNPLPGEQAEVTYRKELLSKLHDRLIAGRNKARQLRDPEKYSRAFDYLGQASREIREAKDTSHSGEGNKQFDGFVSIAQHSLSMAEREY